MGVRSLNTGARKHTELGMELERSAKEILPVLHQPEDAPGVGARAAKARRNDPRIPRGYRQEPRGGVGRIGLLISPRGRPVGQQRHQGGPHDRAAVRVEAHGPRSRKSNETTMRVCRSALAPCSLGS